MHVSGILHDKGGEVVTMGPRASLREAIALMARHRIGAVVIVGVERHVLGIFSERDVVRLLARGDAAVLDQELSRHMTTKVVTCAPDTTIDDLMHLMTSAKFRHVPVIENGMLSGLVSIGDAVKFRLAEVENEHRAMRDYIASG